MFRPVASLNGEHLGEGQERHPPTAERPSSSSGAQPAAYDPLVSSTVMRATTDRPTSRGSSVSEVDELVRRARYAKRELAAIIKELGDIVIDSSSSIADELDDECRAMEVGTENARVPIALPEPIPIKPRQPYQVRHRGLNAPSAPAVPSNAALEKELRRIDEQCEQRMLEERLRDHLQSPSRVSNKVNAAPRAQEDVPA
uniref:Uncharacterized protein n=1 Tax=Anopheles atroparvus TaxID=41427 RepID=A0A182JBL7_ANOAO